MSKVAGKVKQILVIRRDVGMRRGKEIAQGSHAAKAFLLDRIEKVNNGFWPTSYNDPPTIWEILQMSPDERNWIEGKLTTTVVLQAKDLEELLEVKKLCEEAGLANYLITDAGLTEFTEPTVTALGIGPDKDINIDAITGPAGKHPLKLY